MNSVALWYCCECFKDFSSWDKKSGIFGNRLEILRFPWLLLSAIVYVSRDIVLLYVCIQCMTLLCVLLCQAVTPQHTRNTGVLLHFCCCSYHLCLVFILWIHISLLLEQRKKLPRVFLKVMQYALLKDNLLFHLIILFEYVAIKIYLFFADNNNRTSQTTWAVSLLIGYY